MTHDISDPSRPKAFLALPGKFSPTPRSLAVASAFVAGGVFTGAVGWSGHALTLPAGMIFPSLWAFAPSRTIAALVALAHFLAASRGLPVGTAIFYGAQLALGLGLWFAGSFLFVAVHAALWTGKGGWHRPIRYAIATLLMSVPPFGIVGWASPITAAGILFPGWCWFGLAANVAGLLVMTTKRWPAAAIVMGGAFLWSAANWTPPAAPEGWAGIDTSFEHNEAGQYADYAQHMATIAMVRQAAAQGAEVIVLPESAFEGAYSAIPVQIYQWAVRPQDEFRVLAAAGALVLVALLLAMNSVAIWLRARYARQL